MQLRNKGVIVPDGVNRVNWARAAILASAGIWAAAAAGQSFEVATVKLRELPPGMMGLQIGGPSSLKISGDRLSTFGTLGMLVMAAYDLPLFEVSGEPEWNDVQGNPLLFDIQAKAEGALTMGQARLMMQSLLAERFRLKIHREMKEVPVYELALDKGGPKMKESAPGADSKATSTQTRGVWKVALTGVSMTELATRIASNFDQPLLDKTGLAGRYDFTLEYRRTPAGTPVDSGPNIYTALQQVGLKVVHTKAAVSLVVIDHAERPTAN